MSRWLLMGAVGACLCAVPEKLPSGGDPKDAPRWLNDYAQARAEARKAGKPIFLVFR